MNFSNPLKKIDTIFFLQIQNKIFFFMSGFVDNLIHRRRSRLLFCFYPLGF